MRSPVHNVGGWLAHWAARRGHRLAVADGDRHLDYAALEARTQRLAGWLRAGGVEPGDRVALLLANGSAVLEAVFAAARIGAISLPINTRLSPREVRFMLDDCTPRALLYANDLAELAEKVAGSAAHPPPVKLAVGGAPDAYENALAAAAPAAAVCPVSPEDPMMLMYTSGTTGTPKGAVLPHRKTLFNCLNAQLYFDLRSDDRVLVPVPLFHSLGLKILSLPVLYTGGSVILQRRFDPERVWSAVAREGISFLGGVPNLHRRLYEVLVSGAHIEPSSLRFLFTAGSAISPELVRAYHERGLVLLQGYGQTESSILCCQGDRDGLPKAGSVGRPVLHADVRVVADAPADVPTGERREVAEGETGEVVARGPIVMLGYWQRPVETEETLRDGWLHTGDLATRDAEGFVTLAGRAREMIISGGENVYPAEVESVYAEHPAIEEIAVVGVPDPRWGEVGSAHVVVAVGQQLDPEALKAWGRDRLAAFKIPQQFRPVDALPRTATGKVQKHKLGKNARGEGKNSRNDC